jgi:O-antigen/teichoic acid export membrane protein
MNIVRSALATMRAEHLLVLLKRFYANDIARKSMLTLMIQGVARLFRFAFWILVARLFTTNMVGELIFGLSMATVFSNLFVMGGDAIVAREWGYSTLKRPLKLQMAHELINGFFYRGILLIVVSFVGYYLFLNYSRHVAWMQLNLLAFSLVVPFFVMALARAYFVAIRKVFIANCMDLILSSSLLVSALYFYETARSDIYELLISVLLVLTPVVLFLMISSVKNYGIKVCQAKGSQMSFALLRLGNVLYSFVDLVVLKVFSDATNVAHYGIAFQVSVVVTFGLSAINQNIMSKVASSYKLDSKAVFQKKISSYNKIVCVFTMIPVIALAVFGPFLFQLYGAAYASCYIILLILMSGCVVNALLGSVGLMLNMAGYEREVAKTFWSCIVLNLILAITLVHFFAAIGVAISTAVSMVTWNMMLYFKVKRRLGVDPSILSWINKSTQAK